MKTALFLMICSCAAFVILSACSRSNNLLLGRVEAIAGSHRVVVTDCYRTTVSPPRKLPDTASGQAAYRFAPCRDAEVLIGGDELVVNGRSYGHLQQGDAVLVDHGVVSIRHSEPANADTSKAAITHERAKTFPEVQGGVHRP